MSFILIIEDQPSDRKVLRACLDAVVPRIEEAASAEEALAYLDEAPSVAFVDVHLGGANGLWLADKIRERSRTTAIVLATGDPAIPPTESLRPGIVGYLVKPFELDAVRRMTQDGLRWSANARDHERNRGPTPELRPPRREDQR